MKKEQFTLLELLVVVAIIGILITILLPSLHKARESARRAVCGSNMSQCGQAISMYTNDWDGYMPATDGGGKRKNGVLRKGGDNSEWKTTLMPYLGLKVKEGSKSNKIFECPSNKLQKIIGNKKYAGGIGYNVDYGHFYQNFFGDRSEGQKKLISVDVPSETVALGDTIDWPTHNNQVKRISRPGLSAGSSVGNRHNKGMNVLWSDFSMRWMTQSALRTGKDSTIDYYYLIKKE